jgi:hypothetical protein
VREILFKGVGSEGGRKYFFFEKKKQKTLTDGGRGAIQTGPGAPTDKSFLVLFLKKGTSFLVSFQ